MDASSQLSSHHQNGNDRYGNARQRLRHLLTSLASSSSSVSVIPSMPLPKVLFSLIIDYTVTISIAMITRRKPVSVLTWPSFDYISSHIHHRHDNKECTTNGAENSVTVSAADDGSNGVFTHERWQWHTKHLPPSEDTYARVCLDLQTAILFHFIDI
jgi:hypothetical protein